MVLEGIIPKDLASNRGQGFWNNETSYKSDGRKSTGHWMRWFLASWMVRWMGGWDGGGNTVRKPILSCILHLNLYLSYKFLLRIPPVPTPAFSSLRCEKWINIFFFFGSTNSCTTPSVAISFVNETSELILFLISQITVFYM